MILHVIIARDHKFYICLCCEVFAFRLIEKQIRDVKQNELIKTSNIDDLIDVEFD